MEIVNVEIYVNPTSNYNHHMIFISMKWLDRKQEFIIRRPQLSLFISFIKGLVVGLLICHFIGCEYTTILMPTEEFPVFELSGISYWQLQHEGEGDDRKPIARVILQMYAYYDGVVDEVWFHGKIMDRVTYELISEDSVYIGHFVGRADSTFTIYKQDGYDNRPEYPKWTMWVTSEYDEE